MNKTIINKNDVNTKNSKGNLHGYQEWYNFRGVLYIRGVYKNGKEIGYEETHINEETNYYIR